jgi:hypothetical protein
MVDKNVLVDEMINKQLKNINILEKLTFKELLRITKNINTSLFGKHCCLWEGYYIEKKNKKYINFFFHRKKRLLKRLLYVNFIGKLNNTNYIRTTCGNDLCCNINHIIMINNNTNINTTNSNINNDNNKTIKKITIDFD